MNMKKTISLFFGLFVAVIIFAQQAPASVSSSKNSDPAMPIYLVNGVETPYEKVLKINTATIESMNVYKGPEAIAKFGSKYKHGVVLVKLKKGKK